MTVGTFVDRRLYPGRYLFSLREATGRTVVPFLLMAFLYALTTPAFAGSADEPSDGEIASVPPQPAGDQFRLFKFVFEPDAYYTDLDLIVSLTNRPVPHLGEVTEMEIYGTLLTRAAVLPQFLVIEGSVNPLPWFGTYLKKHDPGFYEDAQVSGNFNWVKAVTAGFDEPYAVSLLAGNVANFYVPGSRDTKGLGYSGWLYSAGNYFIRDNELIRDRWQEFEWKMKGDRKSPVKKLSWSFRIGAKLHDNPDIADTLYVGIRRSRLDYQPEEDSILNNSGFEYKYDMDLRTYRAVRHYFFVDKKWPFKSGAAAFSLAVGFIWDSAKRFSGVLASGRGNDLQYVLRPNIEF